MMQRCMLTILAFGLALLMGGCPTGPVTTEGLPRVRMTTTAGTFVIETLPDLAPRTTENFLRYVDDGFYAGVLIHRVIPGFVIQGGGYEPGLVNKPPTRSPIANESLNGLRNVRYSIAMARTEDPDSAATEFFINLVDNITLDATLDRIGYAVFGGVVEGRDVIDAIAAVDTETRDNFRDVPVTDVVIQSAVREVGPERITPEWQAFLDDLGLRTYTAFRQFLLSLIQSQVLR